MTTPAPIARLYREWLRRIHVEGRYDDRLFLGRLEIARWALDGHKETDPHVSTGTARPAPAAGA